MLRALPVFALLALASLASAADHIGAQRDCEALSIEYAAMLDGNDPAGLAALFTPAGIWQLADKPMRGRGEIQAYLTDFVARKKVTTLHVMSNVRVQVLDATHAQGTAYVTIYGIEKGAALGLPRSIGVYHDRFEHTSNGWRFSERILEHISK